MQMQDGACCAVRDPNCKVLRTYLHNDYDDDGGVGNDDDGDDAHIWDVFTVQFER